MRISINLATKPFVELRPLYARLRLAMAALFLTAIALGVGLHFLSARARANQAQMDALKAQTLSAQLELQANETRMREPQNQAILARAHFLNDLFAHKSFSWTAVMMDLERVLPGGVQVTSIEPSITPAGGVNIRLRVTGDRDLSVDLVRNLEHSQRFLSPHLNNETAQTKEAGREMQAAQPIAPGAVQFDIMSGYNPLPESPRVREQLSKKDKESASETENPAANIAAKPVSPKPAIQKTSAMQVAPLAAKPKSVQSKSASSKPSANGGAR
jgi:type IV pilus assembly protein PilN